MVPDTFICHLYLPPHYVDVRTGFGVGSVASANEVIFGDAQDNRDLLGHAGWDHLYGYGGNDILNFEGGSAACTILRKAA